jgi:hypothetical protein
MTWAGRPSARGHIHALSPSLAPLNFRNPEIPFTSIGDTVAMWRQDGAIYCSC